MSPFDSSLHMKVPSCLLSCLSVTMRPKIMVNYFFANKTRFPFKKFYLSHFQELILTKAPFVNSFFFQLFFAAFNFLKIQIISFIARSDTIINICHMSLLLSALALDPFSLKRRQFALPNNKCLCKKPICGKLSPLGKKSGFLRTSMLLNSLQKVVFEF